MTTTMLAWFLFPGGGNFYNGATRKGIIEFAGTAGGIALMATSLRDYCEDRQGVRYCGEKVSQGQFWGGVGVLAGSKIWGLVTAIRRTGGINDGTVSTMERFRVTVPTKKGGFKVAYVHSF